MRALEGDLVARTLLLALWATVSCWIRCRTLMPRGWTLAFVLKIVIRIFFRVRNRPEILVSRDNWITPFLQVFLNRSQMAGLWGHWLTHWSHLSILAIFVFVLLIAVILFTIVRLLFALINIVQFLFGRYELVWDSRHFILFVRASTLSLGLRITWWYVRAVSFIWIQQKVIVLALWVHMRPRFDRDTLVALWVFMMRKLSSTFRIGGKWWLVPYPNIEHPRVVLYSWALWTLDACPRQSIRFIIITRRRGWLWSKEMFFC